MSGAATSGAGAGAGAGGPSKSRRASRGYGSEPATEENQLQKYLEAEMKSKFASQLIKAIKNRLGSAEAAQIITEKENAYFITLFELYKAHLDETERFEHSFSTKLKSLQLVFKFSRLPITRSSIASSIKSGATEGKDRQSGNNNGLIISNMFKDSRDAYKRYLLTKFTHYKDTIAIAITHAFEDLNKGNIIHSSHRIRCTKKKEKEKESDKTFVFYLSITDRKIELRCNLDDKGSGINGPMYECAFYISQEYNTLLLVAKITGTPRFRNIHITQVYPLFDRDANESYASPHITFASPGTEPEQRLYIDSDTKGFSLFQVLTNVNTYIENPHQTTKGLFLLMNSQYIQELYSSLEQNKEEIDSIESKFQEMERLERERQERLRQERERLGGSTNKILKIKEQIKIIRGKYKTTKLDKYLIQIDKLKEKIEQLKLKDKKNKIKEQIKEVKALHKLNPKKAYVNKMIKLKEKLNNM